MRCSSRPLTLAMFATMSILSACGGGGGGGGGGAGGGGGGGGGNNAAPVANAGTAQTVTGGATVNLNGGASSDPDGTVTSYTWTQTLGTAVTLSNANTVQASFTAPSVGSATTLRFSLVVRDNDGASSAVSSVTITVNPAAVGNVTISGVVRFARVNFSGGIGTGLNHANPVLQPARALIVRAIGPVSPNPIYSIGETGPDGSYSMLVPANTNLEIQVVAQMQRSGGQPSWNVRVQDGTGAQFTYSHRSSTFNSGSGTTVNVDIPTGIAANGTSTTGPRASGPFAIMDTIYKAMQAVLSVQPDATFPILYVDWGSQADGTFFTTANGQHIALLSDLSSDTDEFDEHVVAHEYGHYIEHNFSRSDSLGGSHALGNRLDMRVAFGEGFGYAFAAIVLNDPVSLDSYYFAGHGSGGFNIENNPGTGSPPGGSLGCWCSESSVWSILWDLYDSTNDGSDTIALGLAPLWQVLESTSYRGTPAQIGIFPFITELKVLRPADAAAINAIVAAQNINAAAIDVWGSNETNMPYANLQPLYTPITAGTPVVVRSIDDGGYYNRAGNRRFLRFTATASGVVNIRVTTSNATVAPLPADPDFLVFRNGDLVAVHDDPAAGFNGSPETQPQTETGPLSVVAGSTYVIDAYDCANGCPLDEADQPQGTPGDYDLTVTIN